MIEGAPIVPSKDHGEQLRRLWPGLGRELERVLFEEDPILGASVDRFEEEFARHSGRRHAVGVNSGTDALVLALRALGVGEGDEVIVPGNTFIATVTAVHAVRATPVLVEPDDASMTIDPAAVAAAIGPRTRAVVPVHLYGALADMDALLPLCRRHGLLVVEDAAQAHGARRGGVRAGAFGDAGCFSFHPSKNLGAFGDAGAIVTDDDATAATLRELRNLGKRGKHEVRHLAPNSKLDTLQAAILRVKLPHLDAWNERRRALARRYAEALADVPDLTLPVVPGGEDAESHVFHLFVVRSPRRTSIEEAFRRAGVKVSRHYPVPPHLQPLDVDLGVPRGALPRTERMAEQVLSLPIAPELSDEQVLLVSEVLRDALRR